MSKTAFLFPGQGAQFVGMGRRLAEQCPAAKQLYERANALLGYDLTKLCFEGPSEQLDSTVCSQPALLVTSLAALEWLRIQSPEAVESCVAAAGLSLGEYSALVAAGAMEFETGLSVVRQRGEAMQNASDLTPSGMLSVLGLDRTRVQDVCHQAGGDTEIIQIANVLCPGNIVVSGSRAACQKAEKLALKAGAMKVIPLAVAGAFHTPIMQTAVETLAAVLTDVKLSPPRFPVVSNVDAAYHDDPEEIRDLLVEQVVSPVFWEDSMLRLLRDGHDVFYEIGPGRVLRGLLRRIDRKVTCHTTAA